MLIFIFILLGSIIAVVLGIKYYFSRKTTNTILTSRSGDVGKYSFEKKYPEADLEYYRSLFTRIGLTLALLFVILAFEWTIYDKTTSNLGQLKVAEDIEIEPPQTKQEQLPPPPPPPPQLKIVEEPVKEDERKIEETEANDQTIVPPVVEAAPVEKAEEPEIFTIVEEMPAFKGCENISNEDDKKACTDKKIFEYVSSNVKYPAIARENQIQGRVFINFIVGPDGSVSNVRVLRGIGGGCDEEAIRVIKSLPKWKPGKQRGKSVSVQYNLPVNFKLQ